MKTCLFRYVTKVLHLPESRLLGHAAEWRSWVLYRIFLDLGFEIDCVSWLDKGYTPTKQYDVVLDVMDLTELVPAFHDRTVKILLLTGADNVWRNKQGLRQAKSLNERRGSEISYARKIVNPMKVYESIELADHVLLVGNEWTRSTYPERYQSKIRPINTTYTRLEV